MEEVKKVVKKRKKRHQVAAKPPVLPAVEAVEEAHEASGKMPSDNLRGKRVIPWIQILYLGGGAILLVMGFWVASLWGSHRENVILAMAFIVMFPVGAYLLYRGIKKPDQEAVIVGTKKPESKVNSLNIYAAKDEETGRIYPEKIAFEWVDSPRGQPQQCTNNGKWYYVYIWDIEKQELVPFNLPDSQYFDPREFANVIKMPAHRKLFEHQVSMLQKVAPWVMVAAFLISIFGLITTAPTG